MSTSATKFSQEALAIAVDISDDALTVALIDGRSISVPLTWFPRLAHGTPEERKCWQLIGRGRGIHWDALDEDISVAALIAGQGSGENAASLKRWLESRKC